MYAYAQLFLGAQALHNAFEDLASVALSDAQSSSVRSRPPPPPKSVGAGGAQTAYPSGGGGVGEGSVGDGQRQQQQQQWPHLSQQQQVQRTPLSTPALGSTVDVWQDLATSVGNHAGQSPLRSLFRIPPGNYLFDVHVLQTPRLKAKSKLFSVHGASHSASSSLSDTTPTTHGESTLSHLRSIFLPLARTIPFPPPRSPHRAARTTPGRSSSLSEKGLFLYNLASSIFITILLFSVPPSSSSASRPHTLARCLSSYYTHHINLAWFCFTSLFAFML